MGSRLSLGLVENHGDIPLGDEVDCFKLLMGGFEDVDHLIESIQLGV